MSLKKKLAHASCVIATLAAPIAAHAGSVTYDFTGVVTGVSGYAGVTDGMTVTGTYTINYANANPSQSGGTIGSTIANWEAQNYGGSEYATAPPTLTQYVFSSTLHVGSVSYATTPGTYSNDSYIATGVSPASNLFEGYETSYSTASTYTQSYVLFQTVSTPPVAPWTTTGQPLFSSANNNSGLIFSSLGQIDYNITTFTPAATPLPAAFWLLLSGLGGLGFLARARRRA